MKKKILSTMMVLVLAVLVLAGCGQSNKEETSKAEEIQTEESSEDTYQAGTKEAAEDTEEGTGVPTGHTATEVNIGYVDVTGGGLLSDLLGVARDQGLIDEEFKAIGVTVNWVPMTGAGPAINEALSSGDLDIGELGDVPGVLGKAAGVDTQLIAFGGLNNGASLIAGPDTSYTSIEDLKGKKIATQRGAYMHRTLSDILAAADMNVDDIEFVNVTAQEAAEMLLTGNVDAAVVGGVTLTRLTEQGYKVVVDYREHPELISGGYSIARTKFVEENPDIILAYVKALVRAQKLAKADTDTLLKQWESTGESAESYEYLYPNHDNYYSIEPTESEIENGKNVVQFLLDNELVQAENGFDFESWINSTFYEAAYDELGRE